MNYSQPEAATADDQIFYPQRSTPAELSVVLPKDLPTGEYTMVLRYNDKLAARHTKPGEIFSGMIHPRLKRLTDPFKQRILSQHFDSISSQYSDVAPSA